MNRKAKRNKYRNVLASKNVEINTLKNEVYGYTNAYINTLSDFRKCSKKLEEQEEKTKEYKTKYFDQLKKEFLEGNKELVTLSLAVPKFLEPYNSNLPIEKVEEERKKVLCYELAKSLYDNFDALRRTEYETSTRFDMVLVKWNQSNRNIDDWDEFCGYANINPYMVNNHGFTADELMKGRTRSNDLRCNFEKELV
jgi:hypothetical protein